MTDKNAIIRSLIAVARAAYQTLANSSENWSTKENYITKEDYDALYAALMELEGLPEIEGVDATGPRKAEYYLLHEGLVHETKSD